MRRLVAASVVASVLGLVAPPAAAQDAEGESSPVEAGEEVGTERVVVADGHVDVGPRFLDGTFTLLVRDDTVEPSVWRHLPDVVLHATDAGVVQVPDDPAFAFLGSPGADVWLLPQVQQPGVLWPGWNTQDPEVATTIRREVTWTLHGVEGPGALVLFLNEEFGRPVTVFDSRESYPQETGIEVNTHVHGNWAFTAPGTYRLDIEMSATTLDGGEVAATGTLQVAVGDATDPQSAFAAGEPAGEMPSTTTAVDDEPGADDPADQAAGESEGEGSSSSPVLALAAGVAVVVLVAGAVLVRRARRRQPAAIEEDAS